MNFKSGEQVIIIKGQSRGKKGKILQVFPKKNLVVVEGVNERTRHIRNRRGRDKGQKVSFFAPLNVANVMLFCSKCNKPRRNKIFVSTDGKKQKVCVKCNSVFGI
ncbi:MAG: 50S ribosomal protein L24 [Candidatus Kerfeldbacteria bacterium CG08_land_8_20_14_0_20_43_14]|uniref:Large ribosomal subunit protein uL24 n=1 Tax=Candidatus Kerfeldbacteria bacterium CG08_land_8_20_14_0_20_43_14 TaxID=2014246 RepID=A0A2H0YQD0_9BACT|nr:MAG: 50S ribosomal protein L24 [Candidatus Kerfeldbacteria bacterium CG08_land_8_20_14_0_20_43_14]